jgi:hypothetical protein
MLRVWLAMAIGAATLMVSGLIATMARAQAGADPAAVITAYEMARNRRDLDAAVSYFSDDATISQRTTTFSGKDEIRKFLDGVSTRSRFVVVSDRHSSGNRVTWTERSGVQGPGQPTSAQSQPVTGQSQSAAGQTQAGTGQSQSLNSALAASNGPNTNTFLVNVEAVVQDGKIRSVAYLTATGPGRIDPSLDGRAQLPATAGLGAVLVVMLGMLMVGSLGLRRRAPGSSSLRGRLIEDLQGWTAARQSPSTS